jgi:hypothetical protein
MSDLLSSVSLLLTFIAILYGLWYQEIVRSLETKISSHSLDRVKDYRRVKATLYSRALPLAGASIALTLVFVPDALRILLISVDHTQRTGWTSLFDYNAVSAALVLVTISTAAFACHLTKLVIKLHNLQHQLNPDG